MIKTYDAAAMHLQQIVQLSTLGCNQTTRLGPLSYWASF